MAARLPATQIMDMRDCKTAVNMVEDELARLYAEATQLERKKQKLLQKTRSGKCSNTGDRPPRTSATAGHGTPRGCAALNPPVKKREITGPSPLSGQTTASLEELECGVAAGASGPTPSSTKAEASVSSDSSGEEGALS